MLKPPDARLMGAVFLLGLSVVLLELTFTRIFSVIMWYHFASLSIAVALLGFALGGALLHLRPSLVPAESYPRCLTPYILAFASAASLPFALLGLVRVRPGTMFSLLSFFHQPYYQPFRQGPAGPDTVTVLSLTVLYVVITIPFLAAGLSLAGLFLRAQRGSFGSLYGADLAGAAAACILFVPALTLMGAPSLLLVSAALGVSSAWLLTDGRASRVLTLVTVVLLLGLAAANGPSDRFVSLPFARGQFEPNLLFSRWNALSRVVVYPQSRWEAEQSWGIGRQYTGDVPDSLGMLVDDAGFTPIMANPGADPQPAWAPHHVISVAFLLRPGAHGLVIGPGGGRDVLAAMGSGASRITAIELNPLIVQAVQEKFAGFSGRPFSLPGVDLVIGEGRSELARGDGRYDVIQASSVFGEVSPSAGAFSLSANFLYTREAFMDYWASLKDDGILSLTRSVFGLRALRLASLARDLLLSQGVERPQDHVAVIRERGLATVLVSRSGFTAQEAESIRAMASENGFTIEALPYNALDTRFSRVLLGEDVSEGRFDLSPPTDDRPFFYNNVPPSRFFNVFFRPSEQGERHIIVLRTMALIMFALVALLLALPLAARGGRRPPFGVAVSSAAYFAGIGLGYMVVELTLMHRLVLFLGHPTYSLTVVLVVLLLSSSLGSIFAGRWDGVVRRWQQALPLALILLLLAEERLSALLVPGLDAGLWARIALVSLILAPPGFVMGFFMPLGLSALSVGERSLVPWAWAVNGAASVLGSLGSLVLAMNLGYARTFVVGVAAYALTIPFLRNRSAVGEDARKEVTR